MQEFVVSREDGRPLSESVNHDDKQKNRPNHGLRDRLSDLPGDTLTSQINFGSLSLNDIHRLSKPTHLEFHRIRETSQVLPTLVLDDTNNNTEPHFVATGSHNEITANHLGQVIAEYVIFPDVYSVTIDSIGHVTPVKPHVALATLIQNVAAGQSNSDASTQAAQPTEQTPQEHTHDEHTHDEHTHEEPKQEEQSAVSEFLSGLGNVISEIGQGCVEQVTEHPLECLVAATEVVAVGLLATAAAPWVATGLATAGVVAGSAEVLAVIGAYGAATTTHELLSNAGAWYDAALVVANPEGHSSSELTTAQSELHEVSDFMVEQASGFVGGLHAPHLTPSHNGLRKGIEEDDRDEDEKEGANETTTRMAGATSLSRSSVNLSSIATS